MADMENQEDQKISECLQEAFGYSDEQLLKQLDHVNENFKDVSFAGAEERLMKRFMERKAEMEKKAAEAGPETTKSDARTGAIPEITAEAEECTLVEENRPEPLELEKKQGEKQNKKKIVRFGKKKVLATAALVAVIAGMLGGTAIGKRNFTFRKLNESEPVLRIDTTKNKNKYAKVEEAYKTIEKQLDMPVLKIGYLPSKMKFMEYNIYYDEAQLKFQYGEKIVTFVQMKKEKGTSTHCESDRKISGSVHNEWLNLDITYSKNTVDNILEYETLVTINDKFYYLAGAIPEEEYIQIIKSLNFY